jgi:predicted HTH transcriptional regulator
VNPESYRPIIFAGREDRNREYKQSFSWDRSNRPTMAKVTKTILAMSNLRDGGYIVIGVNQISGMDAQFEPVGIQSDCLQTFSYDNVADFVRAYADPYVSFGLEPVTLDGMAFIVIAVAGFAEFPVICKKSYGEVLSGAKIYVRPRGGCPRSEPISDYVDMRELLDLAVERGVRRFFQMQARVVSPSPSDEERFEQQLGDFS